MAAKEKGPVRAPELQCKWCLPAEIIGQAGTDHVDVVERLGGVKRRISPVSHAEISVIQVDVKILDAAAEVSE